MTDSKKGGASPADDAPAGSRMTTYWILGALKHTRERHGITPRQMGTILEVDSRTIKRHENGETPNVNVDERVAAYAYAAGLDSAREIWEEALEDWRRADEEREGPLPPLFTPPSRGAGAYAETTRQEAIRQRRLARERDQKDRSRSTPTQSEKRRATGR